MATTVVLALGTVGSAQEQSAFLPSAQTTPDGKPVPLDEYAKNTDCVRCHQVIGRQWQGSIHAVSLADPTFQALMKLGSQESKGLTDKLCIGCHSSPAVISGHSNPDEVIKLGPPASDGVSCVVCHSITGSHRTLPDQAPANASFVTDPKGAIIAARGERPCKVPGRKTVTNPLLTRSEFCANCHGVIHPLNGIVIERTYEEWRSSVYAAKGIQCQDCHMQPVEKAIETARKLVLVSNPGAVTEDSPKRDRVYTHAFIGGNTVITGALGAKDHASQAEQLLKNAASLELSLPKSAAAGQTVQLRVNVNNDTAGHNLPTSLVEVRQMWLDIEVTDASGKAVYRSGAVDEKGEIDSDAVMFHAVAVDAEGNPTVKPWAMTRFTYFHTVPPKGHTIERYAFSVPAGTKGPLTVKATLRYRSFPQSVANLLLGANAPTIPIVDMASAKQEVTVR